MIRNEAYIPTPTSSAAAFAVHTPRSRIRLMSTSGLVLRASARTQATRAAAPSASRPSVLTLVQCQLADSLTAISTADRPSAISREERHGTLAPASARPSAGM